MKSHANSVSSSPSFHFRAPHVYRIQHVLSARRRVSHAGLRVRRIGCFFMIYVLFSPRTFLSRYITYIYKLYLFCVNIATELRCMTFRMFGRMTSGASRYTTRRAMSIYSCALRDAFLNNTISVPAGRRTLSSLHETRYSSRSLEMNSSAGRPNGRHRHNFARHHRGLSGGLPSFLFRVPAD